MRSGTTTSLVLPELHFIQTAHAAITDQVAETVDYVNDITNAMANTGSDDCYYSVAYSVDDNISNSQYRDISLGITFF